MSDDARWFDERPARTETCPRCHGHGEVDVPYALRPGGPVTGSPNEAIRAWVCGSYDIFEACREAAEIASRSGEPVAFEFNEQCVVLRPEDDPVTVARAWWKEAYGETPEQTWARR